MGAGGGFSDSKPKGGKDKATWKADMGLSAGIHDYPICRGSAVINMWCPVDWVPEDHSFSVRSLWNRSWWQGVSVERNWREGLKKKIPFLFLIGGGVFGVQPLISSKCCSGAQKKRLQSWEILRSSYPPSFSSAWGEWISRELWTKYLKSNLANYPVLPTSHHNKDMTQDSSGGLAAI